MEGFKVRCQTCGTVLYETTAKYNCHKPLTGDMLKLLPLYKDWPCYDGALATGSTPRFLMFCSQCAGYISTTGKLTFVDFPDKRVTEVSEERSMILCSEEAEAAAILAALTGATLQSVDSPTIEHYEDFTPPPIITPERVKELQDTTPEDLMKKIEKGVTISSKKEFVDNLILPNAEDSALSDDLQKMDPDLMTPEDLMKKLGEQCEGE